MKMPKMLNVLAAAMLVTASSGLAQQQPSEVDNLPRARFLLSNGQTRDAWIAEDSPGSYRVKETPQQTNVSDYPKGSVASVFLYEPKEWREAYELYNQGQYEAALAKMQEIQKLYAAVAKIPGNYSTLADYYAMECLRLTGKYPEMLALGEKIDRREFEGNKLFVKQFELHPLYAAWQKKDWERAIKLGEQMLQKPNFSLAQRVQMYWIIAQSLEALNKPEDALNAYGAVMTGDMGTSRILVKDAVLKSLGIYAKDADVLEMIQKKGTDKEPQQNSAPDIKLKEVAALAWMFENVMFPGEQLPEAYKKFLQYAAKNQPPAAAPAPAPESK